MNEGFAGPEDVQKNRTHWWLLGILAVVVLTLFSLVSQFRITEAAVIDIGGNVYESDGVTPLTNCNGSTAMIRVAVNGIASAAIPCSGGTGGFNFSGITVNAGNVVVIWIDGAICGANNVTGKCATTIIKSSAAGNITDAILVRSQLLVRHDDAGPTTNANLDTYDNGNDPDVVYTVTGTSLTIEDQIRFRINSGDTHQAGGTITTSPSNSAASLDGDVLIDTGATLNMASSQLSVGGDYRNDGTYTKNNGQEVVFNATIAGHTISGNMLGTSAFSRFTTSSTGGWTTTDPVQVTYANQSNTVLITGGSLTIGDSNGDSFEVRGQMQIATGSGQIATVQTPALSQGQSITIDVNQNSTPATCGQCGIYVGSTAGAGQGNLILRKNTVLRLNPRSAASASNTFLIAQRTGYVDAQGTLDDSGVSNGVTDETTVTDSGKTWVANEHQGKAIRVSSGPARGKIYSITGNTTTTLTRTDSSSSDFLISDTTPLVVVQDLLTRVCANSNSIVTADGQADGRYLHDKTGSTGYLRVARTVNNDATNCAGNDSFTLSGNPGLLTILSNGDIVDISDGLQQNDSYEIIDFVHITAEAGAACNATANQAGEGYIQMNDQSESIYRYADICNLGGNGFAGLRVANVNNINANEGFMLEKSYLHNSYNNLQFSNVRNTSINSNFFENAILRCSDVGFSSTNTILQNNRFENCDEAGIWVYNSDGVTIDNNIILHGIRTFSPESRGILAYVSIDDMTIQNNLIADFTYAMLLQNTDGVDINNNTITDLSLRGIMFGNGPDASYNVVIDNNLFEASLQASISNGGTNMDITNNTFVVTEGVFLNSDNAFVDSNYFYGGNRGIFVNTYNTTSTVSNNYLEEDGRIDVSGQDPYYADLYGDIPGGAIVTDNTVTNSKSYGAITTRTLVTDCYVARNTVTNAQGFNGGLVMSVNDADCIIENNTIDTVGESSYTDGLIIANGVLSFHGPVLQQYKMNGSYIVRNNTFANAQEHGIHISNEGPSSDSSVTVYENDIYGNGANGVYIDGIGHNIDIYENNIFNNTLDGVNFDDDVSGVRLHDNDIYGNTQNGVSLRGAVRGVHVEGNSLYDNSNAGILTEGGSADNFFSNNSIYGNDYGLHDSGNNNTSYADDFGVPTANTTFDIWKASAATEGSGLLNVYSPSYSSSSYGDVTAQGFILAPGKGYSDIVNMAYENWNSARLCAFYTDLTFSCSLSNYDVYTTPIDISNEVHNYSLAAGKTPNDIVGITQEGWNNGSLVFFYNDGTYSATNDDSWDGTSDVAATNVYNYTIAPGKTTADIVDVEQELWNNGILVVFYNDGTYSIADDDTWDASADVALPNVYNYTIAEGKGFNEIAGITNEYWWSGKLTIWYRDGSSSASSVSWDAPSDTPTSNLLRSGGIAIWHPNSQSGNVIFDGHVRIPEDNSITPQNESIFKLQYSESLWSSSVTPSAYNGDGNEDQDLDYDISAADFSGGPYSFLVIAKTGGDCTSASFDVFRNGVDVGDVNCGSVFNDSTGFSFRIEGGDVDDYIASDTYSFFAYGGAADDDTQKQVRFNSDKSQLIVSSGRQLDIGGATPTQINRITGGYRVDINGGVIDADGFVFEGMGGTGQQGGLVLRSGSTASFVNGAFNNYATNNGESDSFIEVDSSLIGAGTPSATFANLAFTNSNGNANCNVNAVGTDAAGYWYFNPATGSFAGESFDCNDSSPDPTVGQIGWLVSSTGNPGGPGGSGGGGGSGSGGGGSGGGSTPVPNNPETSIDPGVVPGVPVILSPTDGEEILATQVTVKGTADPGARVDLYDDEVKIGSVFADDDGNWSILFDSTKEDYSLNAEACNGSVCSEKSESINVTVVEDEDTGSIELSDYDYEVDKGGNVEVVVIVDGLDNPYVIYVDWGDGTSSEFTSIDDVITLKHQYERAGNYSATLTLTDSNGKVKSKQFTVRVNEAAPTPAAGISRIDSLKKIVNKVPKIVVISTPYFVLLILLFLILLLIFQSRKEINEIVRFRKRLEVMQELAAEKINFISIASHYLRTPLTVLKGGIELSQSLDPTTKDAADRLSQLLESVSTSVETIISRVTELTASTKAAPISISKEQLKVVLKPQFWIPVSASVVALLFFDAIIYGLVYEDLSIYHLLGQLIIFATLALLLYVIVRNLYLRRKEHSEVGGLLTAEADIDSAKNVMITQSLNELRPEIELLQARLSDLNPKAQNISQRGVDQFNAFLSRFELLKMLSFSKGSTYTTFDPQTVVNEVTSNFREKLEQKSLTLRPTVTAPSLSLLIDEALFGFVIESLVDNAIKFADEGTAIDLIVGSNGKSATITVNDSGVVIGNEQKANLFKPFYRNESVEEFNYEGMGFGLYLLNVIARFAEGSAKLTQNDKQTTASIELPMS